MSSTSRSASRIETLIGIGILIVLVVIAGGVFLKQFHFDDSVYADGSFGSLSTAAPSRNSPLLSDALGDVLRVLTPPEQFSPETLSDKINGKAELYLEAGFVTLHCRRFAQKDDPNLWMEILIYDMGNIRNSFAVFSSQRRPSAKTIRIGAFAYEAGGGLFVAHGRYYVEVIPAARSKSLFEAMLQLTRNFVSKQEVSDEEIPELAMFPGKDLSDQSIVLHPTNGFGFDRFDNVLTATYKLADTEITAFLSLRGDNAQARELADAYCNFLLSNGGKELDCDANIPAGRCIEIFGFHELVFSHERFIAGVHECSDKLLAEQLAEMIHARLAEVQQ